MNICVANSKDQTKKLKHKGSTGKKKENETESETITENEGERNGKKKTKKKLYSSTTCAKYCERRKRYALILKWTNINAIF